MSRPHRVVDYYEHREHVDRLIQQRDDARERNEELESLLADMQPPWYGMLLEMFGNPDDWPDDRLGVILYRRMMKALGRESPGRTPGT